MVQWHLACKTEISDEHLIGSKTESYRVRVVRRRPQGERWSAEWFNGFAGLPWDLKAKQDEASSADPGFAGPAVEPGTRPKANVAGSTAHDGQDATQQRNAYITKSLINKYGPTPGCGRCAGKTGAHSDECRQRIERLTLREAERAEAAARSGASDRTPEGAVHSSGGSRDLALAAGDVTTSDYAGGQGHAEDRG